MGAMEAANEKVLVDKLQGMGYFPITIGSADKKNTSTVAKTSSGALYKRLTKGRYGSKVAGFTYQLHSMLDAGIPLDKALSILADLEQNIAFKNIILDIYQGIQSGDTLADCLVQHPAVFNNTYVSMIRAGEASGAIEQILLSLNSYMEVSRKLKEDVVSALVYPVILVLVGCSTLALMVFFVIPKFSLIFSDMGGALPLSTQLLLQTSELFLRYWWIIVGAMIASTLFIRYRLKSEEGRLFFDSLMLKLPLFGSLVTKTVTSRFARTLGTLLHSGLPILEALSIAKETMGNRVMARDLESVVEGVRRGRGMTIPLKECGRFPPLAVHMLTVGEEAGNLDGALMKLADNFDREIRNITKRLLSFMEPAIILVMALVVGFIVISLLMAIFSLNDMPI